MRNTTVLRPTPLAAAILAALHATTAQVQAAEQQTASAQQLPKISVGSDAEDSYKQEVLSSPKYTEVLRDTPQTVLTDNYVPTDNLLAPVFQASGF